MNKKILVLAGTLLVAIGGIAALSAFEAHVINVTAKIENALSVSPDPLAFGTVFPNERLEKDLTIRLSDSFLGEDRVDDVGYKIVQKPKPRNPQSEFDTDYCIGEKAQLYACINEEDEGTPQEAILECFDQYDTVNCYPSLCQFLSKEPDNPEGNDHGIGAMHPIAQCMDGIDNDNDNLIDYPNDPDCAQFGDNSESQTGDQPQVYGVLSKLASDVEDTWTVDLEVPCFIGQCRQGEVGWLPPEWKSQEFGCDLWIEATDLSVTENGGNLCEQADIMLVLDRSGSIDAPELASLKGAAHDFVHALNPDGGVHIGQTSFATNGTLDTQLTGNHAIIDGNISALVSGGTTNLSEGISLANTELAGPRDRTDSAFPDFMIIITDGNWNEGSDPTAAANAADAAGTQIYVVGVGNEVNAAFLTNNIATDANHYFGIADYSSLETALNQIAACGGVQNEVGSKVSPYVSPTVCNVNVSNGGAEPNTIAEGIAAATPGQEVCVADGTYNENVTIDKSLTLAALNGPTASAIINGVVEITANNVTVKGFNINGALSTAPDYAGIYMWASTSGHRLMDNVLDGSDTAGSRGILFGYNVTDVIVKNNIIRNWASGSYINPTASGGILFIYNDLESNAVGIGSDGINNVDVFYNEFDSNTAEAIGMSDSGGGVSQVRINSNNLIPAGAGNDVNAYGTVGDVTRIDATQNWWAGEAEASRTNDTASVDTSSPAGAIFAHK